MRNLVYLLLLILLCTFSLSAQTKVTPEEYAVYESVLKDIYKDNRATYSNKSHFVIVEKTQVDSELDLPSSKRYKNLVENFNQKNLISGYIEKNFPVGEYSETYYLVKQNEIDELFEKGEIEYKKRYEIQKLNKSIINPGGTIWTSFYDKYPEASGYYTISRVGFDKSMAMVQVKREDIYSGFSRIYILKKVKNEWKIVTFSGIESAA